MISDASVLVLAAAIVEQATPGPWYAVNEHGEPTVLTRTPWREPRETAYGAPITYDYIAQTTYDMQSTTERPTAEADARLISLAPSLGAALALAKAVEEALPIVLPCNDGDALTAALAAFKASLAESIKED